MARLRAILNGELVNEGTFVRALSVWTAHHLRTTRRPINDIEGGLRRLHTLKSVFATGRVGTDNGSLLHATDLGRAIIDIGNTGSTIGTTDVANLDQGVSVVGESGEARREEQTFATIFAIAEFGFSSDTCSVRALCVTWRTHLRRGALSRVTSTYTIIGAKVLES